MKKFFSLTLTLAAMLSAMAVSAQAADYSFETDGTPEYYPSSSYEDVYGSRYNYGGKNVVDYQSPELEYGQLSTTQTGVMEKIMLPGLQGISASGSGIYGISPGGGTVEIPGFLQGGSTTSPATPAFTELTQDFLLSNGAVGKISIPAIGVKNYYLWEGETTASMKKGLGHFTGTSVWNGNVAVCGHNRGAKYVIGSIKDLDVGDKITYTTSMGTRTYLVETVTKISSSDWSYLSSTTDNRMTLLTVHDVTLEYPGQIIKLSAYDKPASLGVTITKRGNAQVMAGQSMRYDLTVANTSNVPLESFFWHDKIPYDVARPTTLTTGTYSARLNYRILYKTNCNTSYQVLASNLLTSNNYSFSLNAIPMQAGEVVTDIYFDFGKVPVGFQSVVNPTLSVMVNGNAVNGYQMVNRADVGGKYQGTWQTATASWVTIIRRLWNTPTLPKTGY